MYALKHRQAEMYTHTDRHKLHNALTFTSHDDTKTFRHTHINTYAYIHLQHTYICFTHIHTDTHSFTVHTSTHTYAHTHKYITHTHILL